MTLRRRGRVGGGRRPTVGERGAYNVQAAGSAHQQAAVDLDNLAGHERTPGRQQ